MDEEKVFCKNCGAEVSKYTGFCPKCGTTTRNPNRNQPQKPKKEKKEKNSSKVENVKETNLPVKDESIDVFEAFDAASAASIDDTKKVEEKPKKNKKSVWWIPLLILLILIGVVVAGIKVVGVQKVKNIYQFAFSQIENIISPDKTPAVTVPVITTTTELVKTTSVKSFDSVKKEYVLSAGNYTVGIDIPAGKCNVVAVSGTGTLSSSNMYKGGINTMFGKGDDVENYTSSFKGLKLPDKTTLYVNSNLKIKLTYTVIESSFTGRTYNDSAAKVFTDGNYEAGVDFKSGTYKIVAVSGKGNLSTSNMYNGGLNEIFGVDEGDGHYNGQFLNVKLEKGVTMTVSGGLKIKLVPEGPAPATTTTTAPSVFLDKSAKVYHIDSGCSDLKKVLPENRVNSNESAEKAKADGYSACKICVK